MAKITAYAWASGLIEFGQTLPDGALPIITGEENRIRDLIDINARHSVQVTSFLCLECLECLKPVTNMRDVMH